MAKTPPLIIEKLEDPSNLHYITLLEYKRLRYLTVVENMVGDEIHAYVLDNLEAEGVDPEWFMRVVTRWFYSASDRYPLSFEVAKQGQADVVKKVMKTFNVNSISRVVGRIFKYDVDGKPKVKRRKVVPVSPAIEIKFKRT